MKPSQRVILMKQIAPRLSAEDFSLIDLTLQQFGLPWSDTWNDTKQSYVLQMIKDAPDQILIDLASHVGVPFEPIEPRVAPAFWQPAMFRVFLSHLAVHRALAGQLQESLLKFGITTFVAHNDIEPTVEWLTQIETALATCESLVAMMHPTFHTSSWTDQEIGYAMGRGVPTFAIRYGQDPYGFIGRFQAFTAAEKSTDVLASELFTAYRKHKQTQRRMADILVTRFEQSISFADAKTKISHLEDLEVWDPSFAARLKAADESNSQINGSWGVSDRVKKLIGRWA